jgi:hypothetical protein
MENEQFQVLFNSWDIGEGRLRPRRTSKLNNDPIISKVKCDICQKFFRVDYIKVCQNSLTTVYSPIFTFNCKYE